MDILLLGVGLLFVILGVFGSFLPVLPGPSLSFIGLVLLYCTDAIPVNYWILGISLVITLLLTVLDYIIPARGTKKFGGSSYGIWGTNIGLIVGLLAPIPFGFIIGPFVGAFIGEIIYDNKDHQRALKAATGSFIGFLASSFLKFIVCVMHFGVFVWVVWQYKDKLFWDFKRFFWNTKHYKIKKAVRRDEKLFIGLTTKPRYELQIRSKQHN